MSQTTKRIHSEDESAEQWRLSRENYWRCLDFSTNSPSSPDPDGGVTCMNSNVRATCKKIKKNKNAISNNGNKPHTPPSFCVYEINNVRNIRTPWKHCRYAAAAWFPYGLCITPSTFWIKYSRDHTTCRAGKKTQRYSSTEQRSKGGRERGSEGERESRNTRAAPVN